MDNRNASPHGSSAHLQRAVTVNECGMTNLNSGDVGYRVQRARRTFKWNTEISAPAFLAGDSK